MIGADTATNPDQNIAGCIKGIFFPVTTETQRSQRSNSRTYITIRRTPSTKRASWKFNRSPTFAPAAFIVLVNCDTC